nr:hypothetical protein [Bernardetiaceae bacterium]
MKKENPARRVRTSLFLLFALLAARLVAQNGPSVLASGQWYKVAVPQTGLYKIDRGFWQRLGVDAAQ